MIVCISNTAARKTQGKHFFAGMLIALLATATPVMAADHPDDLYRQGRFPEAEKAYAEADMDRPKDVRFRYNRGCSAYQNADYQAALAAFSSVLRRSQDNKTRFRAVYNMGNTAMKQGELTSAVNYYKQAILYDPQNSDAPYNLEFALREIKKQEENQQRDDASENQQQPGPSQDKEGKTEQEKQSERPEQGTGESSREEASEKEQPESQEQKRQGKQSEMEQQPMQAEQEAWGQDAAQQEAKQSPQDLSGKLEPMEALPEKIPEDQDAGSATSMMDRKKAEALLDNIKEDRSGLLRYQVPQEKRRGVSSGKDW
jgi:Ca-activated chloride channel family protein